jgi:hypothetical protein
MRINSSLSCLSPTFRCADSREGLLSELWVGSCLQLQFAVIRQAGYVAQMREMLTFQKRQPYCPLNSPCRLFHDLDFVFDLLSHF